MEQQSVKTSNEAAVAFSKAFPKKKTTIFTDLKTVQLANAESSVEKVEAFLAFDSIDSNFTVISPLGSVDVVPYDRVLSIGS